MLRSIVARTVLNTQYGHRIFGRALENKTRVNGYNGLKFVAECSTANGSSAEAGEEEWTREVDNPYRVEPVMDKKFKHKWLRASQIPGPDMGKQGELLHSIDDRTGKANWRYPDEDTPNLMFDGIKFSDLHIVHMRVTKNNTIMTLTDSQGRLQPDPQGKLKYIHWSIGREGFKNARKKNTVAAQATGITFGKMVMKAGINNVRAAVGGFGPGRIAGLVGMTMSGLNIVSITDKTGINWKNVPRPRKKRRV